MTPKVAFLVVLKFFEFTRNRDLYRTYLIVNYVLLVPRQAIGPVVLSCHG